MLTQQLQLGLLVLAFGVNALLAYGLYRLGYRHPDDRSAGVGAVDDPIDSESGTVKCPTCGAKNDPDYRYCGSCVHQLPTATGIEGGAGNPFRQTI